MKALFHSSRSLRFIFTVWLFAVNAPLHADYAVSATGNWPKDWPKELEAHRANAQSFEGPMLPLLHYGISFKTREDFEAAWPAILGLKSKGAPIVLKKGPNFWLSDGSKAGVCIHTPPAGQKAVSGKEAEGRWERTIYIELIVDGDIVDLNRIKLPADTPIQDARFPSGASQKKIRSTRTKVDQSDGPAAASGSQSK